MTKEEALKTMKKRPAAQPAPVQPVAWMQSDEVHISLWKDDYHTIPLYTAPPAHPAVPDAMTSSDIQENIEYVAGWN
jgi:hypothetical protein